METSENGKCKKDVNNRKVFFEMDSEKRQDEDDSPEKEKKKEDLIHELNDHFKDPYTRICRNHGMKRFPEKLFLLPFVWVMCTYQLILFGDDRSQFASFIERSSIAMKHLLLKDWSPIYETLPYPPSTGEYAIYTLDELLQHINYSVTHIYTIPTRSVGSFFVKKPNGTETPVTMCLKYYDTGIYDEMSGEIASVDLAKKTVCKPIERKHLPDYGFNPSIEELMRSTDGKLVRLLSIDIIFNLTSVHLNIKTGKSAQCFKMHGSVNFDNSNINGQIPVKLHTRIVEVQCSSGISVPANSYAITISAIVLIVCTLHSICCFHAWISSAILFWRTQRHYREETKKRLSSKACWEIFKLNDFLHCCSNLVAIIGTILKINIDQGAKTQSIMDLYDSTGIFLGIGCLFTWLGVLHYLAYDHVFSPNDNAAAYDPRFCIELHQLFFSVIERSAIPVLKFLACVFILFVGFALCGWVVLGPYHLKFSSLASTFQVLLSLANGDDIFTTFTAVDTEKQLVWFFNGAFLVVFITLFTLVTINIFIAIFNTAYERSNNNEYRKEKRSDLLKYLGKNETRSFDTPTCSKCVKRTCPSMLGCMSFCDDETYHRKSFQFT